MAHEEKIAAPALPTPWLPALATSLGVGLVYLGHLSSHYNLDGTVFAFWLAEALDKKELGTLWHPRHLLYLPMGYIFAKALAALGLNLISIAALQLLDTVFAFLALLVFFRLSMSQGRDRFAAIIGAAALGFSFGFWYFAIEPEVDVPHAFFLMAGFAALLYLTAPDAAGAWPLKSLALGGIGALVMASHLSGGLFLLPLGWGALWRLRRSEGTLSARFRAGIISVTLLAVVAFGLAGALYAYGYSANPLARGQEFFSWVQGRLNPATGLGYDRNYWALRLSSLPDWAYGWYTALVAGPDYRYDDFSGLSPLRVLVMAGALAGIGIYLARLPRLIRQDPRFHSLLLFALIPPALFTMVWDPRYFELKVLVLPFFWLAVTVALADLRRSLAPGWSLAVTAVAVVLAAALFAHNYVSSIRPGADPARNLDLQRALFVRDHTPPDAVIYIAGTGAGYNNGKIYLPYFAKRQARVVDWIVGRQGTFPRSLLDSIFHDRSRPVFALSELLEPGKAMDSLAAEHKLKNDDIPSLFKSLGLEKIAAMPDGFALYRVTFQGGG